MIEVIIPEMEAGITILRATSNFLAPRAYAPSLSNLGTDIIASSLREEIIGIIINPITNPALNALKIIRSGKTIFNFGVT